MFASLPRIASLALAVGGVASFAVAAQATTPEAVVKTIMADATWQAYYTPVNGFRDDPGYFMKNGLKPEAQALVTELKQSCAKNYQSCDVGRKALRGKADPKVQKWTNDVLEIAKWGTKDKQAGAAYVTKIGNQSGALVRAAWGARLMNVPQGAAKIAATMATPAHLDDLYAGCQTHYPARGLWLYGARGSAQVDAMLVNLTHKPKLRGGRLCELEQLSWVLPVLDTWTLPAEKQAKLESFCVEDILPEKVSKPAQAACMRYLGAIGTSNAEAADLIVNFAGGTDNYLRQEAIRTAGRLGLKGTKAALQKRLASAYSKKTTRVKKGRKYKAVTSDTWNSNFDAHVTAVALLGMGDKTASKAIDYWLGFSDDAFTWNQGFEAVARELPFAHPKVRTSLHKRVAGTWKKAAKAAASKQSLQRSVFRAALGLSQVGDKAALKYLMEVLNGSDKNLIQETLIAWGGSPDDHVRGARSTVGTGRLPIGKGGFSAADGQAVVKLIKRKLNVWKSWDRGQAVEAALAIEAQIDLAKR